MMAKLKDKMDADKKKLAIFEARIEDNSEEIRDPMRYCRLTEGCPSGSDKGMSRKDRGQDRNQPRTKQYRNRDQPGRSGGQRFGGKSRRNEG
jgi:hypothetical protein